MDFDDTKFPNNDPNLVARGRLSDGGVWHQITRGEGRGTTFRFEDGTGRISYVELTGEQMMVIAVRAYNS